MVRLLLVLTLMFTSLNVQAKKKDWFFNPECDIRKLWDAVPKGIEIPEMKYCSVWLHPDGYYTPRYDPKSLQDYVETQADLDAKKDLKPLTPEQIKQLWDSVKNIK